MKIKLDENENIIFEDNGNLPPGIFDITITEIEKHYSFSPKRKKLIEGLKMMLTDLKDVGCEKFYLDGSFVTNKLSPGDFDACWEMNKNIDFNKINSHYPELKQFAPPRAEQKSKYFGEAFISNCPAGTVNGISLNFLDFFQKDKITGNAKGILLIKL